MLTGQSAQGDISTHYSRRLVLSDHYRRDRLRLSWEQGLLPEAFGITIIIECHMNIIVFVSLLLVIGAFLLLAKQFRARERRDRLRQVGRVSTWQDVEIRRENFVKIVQTNFGYGKEVWAFVLEADQIDLTLRAFKTGVLILPRPKLHDVERFCQSHGIKFSQTLVK